MRPLDDPPMVMSKNTTGLLELVLWCCSVVMLMPSLCCKRNRRDALSCDIVLLTMYQVRKIELPQELWIFRVV